MAVHTKLGWVLSGPMKGNGEVNNIVNIVNFVGDCSSDPQSACSELDKNVKGLWDLETLGKR